MLYIKWKTKIIKLSNLGCHLYLPVQTAVTITGHCSLVDLSDIRLHECELIFVLWSTLTTWIGWCDNLGLICISHFRWRKINVFWLSSPADCSHFWFDSCWFLITKWIENTPKFHSAKETIIPFLKMFVRNYQNLWHKVMQSDNISCNLVWFLLN